MVETVKVNPVETFVGRAVLSRVSASKLGQLHDLIVNPIKGTLAGVAVKMSDGSLQYVESSEVYSIGPDAVMVNNDRSAISPESSAVKDLPLALNKLSGVEVITEGGKTLGQIANIFIHLAEEPVLLYEVRSSLFDKLLGHALFFPASQGRAFSTSDTRLLVADDTAEVADNSMDALATRLFGPQKEGDPVVVIRSRGY
jgi:uncharacterized protein YrrD